MAKMESGFVKPDLFMWNKPYTLREGTVIVAGLLATGLLLQLTIGPLEWQVFAWPANIITLAALIATLIAIWSARRHVYFFRFMTTTSAAVPAIAVAALLTAVMGLTKQVPEEQAPSDTIGITRMLAFWPFVLVYAWMTLIVGEVTTMRLFDFSWRRAPSLMSHAGLFIVLTGGTLGSADMQRLKMYCEVGTPEWRALDANNQVHELPLAIQLEKFTIDEYPPKLMMTNAKGEAIPRQNPAQLLIDTAFVRGELSGWSILVEKRIENGMPAILNAMAGKMPEGMMARLRADDIGMAHNRYGFVKSQSRGTASALYVSATKGEQSRKGWISSGSYLFAPQSLILDHQHILVMPPREPRRYASTVELFTKKGQHLHAEIYVNKPLSVEGWDIYQLSYNQQMGKWSTLSVFELVADPWLPVVYTGVFMLFVGAICMFLMTGRRKELKT